MPSTRSRDLRRDATNAEALLWRHLRNRQLDGWKFRRQMPVGRYIADFACEAARLVIELDGGQHALRAEADAARTAALEDAGHVVLRFWNNDVLANTEGVLHEILAALRTASNRPFP